LRKGVEAAWVATGSVLKYGISPFASGPSSVKLCGSTLGEAKETADAMDHDNAGLPSEMADRFTKPFERFLKIKAAGRYCVRHARDLRGAGGRGVSYVIRIPANKILELAIEDILFRPPGRPSAASTTESGKRR
jgi:hypothetical protein